MTSPRTTVRLALASVLVLALAACGDDDSDTPGAEAPPGNAGSEGPSGDGGAPYPLFASSLHTDVDLPAPGSAVVTVGGTTYEFDQLSECGLIEVDEGRGEGFYAEGESTADDGRGVRFSLFRSVNTSGNPATGATYETDAIDLFVEQEPGGGLESNSYRRGDRPEDGGGVLGPADEMPFVFVVDDDGSLSASAMGEVDYLAAGMPDAAPTGDAVFAVNCG